MADCKDNEITVSERDQGECSDPTVEIKIKTLDSQTYTIRVNKFVNILFPIDHILYFLSVKYWHL